MTSKGQISIELLMVVGVVIMFSVLFAVYYLSSISQKIDDVGVVPDDDSVEKLSKNTVEISNYTNPLELPDFCGNSVIDPREVCDTEPHPGTFPTGMTCADIGSTGSLTCINCKEIICN
jgi:hypothetical protein